LLCYATLTTLPFAACAQEHYLDLSLDELMRVELTAASSFPQTPFDASATVSRVDESNWRRRGARTLADALELEPGVMLLSAPTGGTLIQVRSYASTSLRGRATLFDGVPINTFAFGTEVFSNGRLPLALLDSVELVRGPSSVLYGSDALHSAVVMQPTSGASDRVDIRASENDFGEISGRGSQRFANQQIDFAAAVREQGERDRTYDYLTLNNTTQTAARDEQYRSRAAMLRWSNQQEDWKTSALLLHDYHRADDFPGGGTLVGNTAQYDRADQNSDLSLLKLGASHSSSLGEIIGSGYFWHNDYGQEFYRPLRPLGTFALERQQFVESRAGITLTWRRPDLWISSRQTTELALSAGYEESAITDHDFERLLLAPTTTPLIDPSYEGLHQYVASLQIDGKTYINGKTWQLVYGGRRDEYSTFGNTTSPRLGVITRPTERDSIRLLYSKAFRAPNANELHGTSFAYGDEELDPETLGSIELGYLHTWSSTAAELVIFSSKWQDRIIAQVDNGRLRYGNSGDSQSRGVESRLRYRNADSMLDVSLTWTDSDGKEGDWVSDLFPRWMLTPTAGHSWPAVGLETTVALRHHSSVATGDEAIAHVVLPETGPYWRADWSLTKKVAVQWQLQFTIRNVFDRDNRVPSIVNSRDGVADLEREFELRATYEL
jgi:iron complex outermembrane receptor protein